jgi:hypothetical protein
LNGFFALVCHSKTENPANRILFLEETCPMHGGGLQFAETFFSPATPFLCVNEFPR